MRLRIIIIAVIALLLAAAGAAAFFFLNQSSPERPAPQVRIVPPTSLSADRQAVVSDRYFSPSSFPVGEQRPLSASVSPPSGASASDELEKDRAMPALPLYNASTTRNEALEDVFKQIDETRRNGTFPLSAEQDPESVEEAHTALSDTAALPEPSFFAEALQNEDESVKPSSAGAQEKETAPVIAYNTANRKGAGNAVRGRVAPVEAVALPSRRTGKSGLPLHCQDVVVPYSFIVDMAEFLAANYWPAGTHLSAKEEGITTVTLPWLNSRYGHSFRGLDVVYGDPLLERRKVLSYVLTPAMVNALSRLYSEHFLDALQRAGYARFASKEHSGNAEVAGMLNLYSLRAKSLGAALTGFLEMPEGREKVATYIHAERKAEEAHRKYGELRFSQPQHGYSASRAVTANYQQAIRVRDQAKIQVAAMMRRAGDTRGLSADELSYIALWVARRDPATYPGISAMAQALERLADHMAARADRIRLERP